MNSLEVALLLTKLAVTVSELYRLLKPYWSNTSKTRRQKSREHKLEKRTRPKAA